MPASISKAIEFLESQWSSITVNKLKGIEAELRFEQFLLSAAIAPLFEYIIPGGWIISPGKNTVVPVTTTSRIAVLPISTEFSWSGRIQPASFTAQVLAHSYFRQVGIDTYFAQYDTLRNPATEALFSVPRRQSYLVSYPLNFFKVGRNGLDPVPFTDVVADFPLRNGALGMRAYNLNRITRGVYPWTDAETVSNLFWKEYARYYIHHSRLVSSNDLDFFIVGRSGRAYPIEFKSKTAAPDPAQGDFFGLDIGPFSKLAFFVSLSNNMEALYFVEEVDANGNLIEYWGLEFSLVLKYCHWVSQSGGRGMRGAMSSTVKIPKAVFKRVVDLLPTL